MNRYLQILGMLIILQLIVSAVVLWPKSSKQQSDAVFLNVPPAAVNNLVLADMQNNSLTLKKSAQGWEVQQNNTIAPANTEQVDALINALTRSPAGWPVSTSEDALGRFAVAENDYQWKVTVKSDNPAVTETIFLGTTVNSAKRHARHSNNSSVYALNYSLSDKAVNAKDWLKRDVLALSVQNLVSINAGDYVLNRVNNEWRFPDQTAKEVVDQELVEMFTARLNSLRIDNLASGPLLDKLKNEKPIQSIVLTASADNDKTAGDKIREWVYEFYKVDDKNYVKRKDVENFYEMSLLAASDLLKIRSQWLTVESIKDIGSASKPSAKAPAIKTNQAPLQPDEITGFD
jgi:phage pi2 protein 07